MNTITDIVILCMHLCIIFTGLFSYNDQKISTMIFVFVCFQAAKVFAICWNRNDLLIKHDGIILLTVNKRLKVPPKGLFKPVIESIHRDAMTNRHFV